MDRNVKLIPLKSDDKADLLRKLQGRIHFEKILTASNESRYRNSEMVLPAWFVAEYGDKIRKSVLLRCPSSSKAWTVRLSICFRRHVQVKMVGGWKAFVTVNGLAKGDTLIFSLKAVSEFEVYLFRGDPKAFPSRKRFNDSKAKNAKQSPEQLEAYGNIKSNGLIAKKTAVGEKRSDSAYDHSSTSCSLTSHTRSELHLLSESGSKFSGLRGAAFPHKRQTVALCAKGKPMLAMTIATDVSRFEPVTMAPADPILGVSEAFKRDNDESKLNLGVGAYRTEDLQPYVLDVVKKAEKKMLESGDNRGDNKEYLPIEGLAAFNKATAELLLGADNAAIKENRVATVQGLSGTGSLRLGAAFIQRYFPGTTVYISSPTWGNHKNIFNDAGVPWKEYRYFDPKTVGLDFEGMMADIENSPDSSIMLLHGCAHNPTGIDPTPEQWEKIADLIQQKNHMAFFDVAYQGFASGSLDDDASSVRRFVARGMEVFVAQSYSKNLGLYAERVGAINAVVSSPDVAVRVKSQLKRLARPMYSNPPVHGARIVAIVVGDSTMFDEWRAEMQMMAGRIKTVRQRLYDELSTKDKSGKDWSFVLKQIGMFSFTGLNKAQSDNMTDKWHVYMTKDGRISLAGLNLAKCASLADAIIDSFYNVQ